jgi:hypothetical protein
MKSEYLKLIAECDKNLSLLRESWMESSVKKKSRWMGLINQALDERFRLMTLRDGKAAA